MKMGQHVVDVGIFEMAIPFDLQMKFKLPFFFPTMGVTAVGSHGFVATAAQKYISYYRNTAG